MAKRIIGTTPKQDGYRMPAEFEPQQGVWMLWPERNDNWRDGGKPAQKAFADVAKAIAKFEKVTVGASVRQYQNARAKLPENIRVVELESDDAWVRDCGPTFLIDGKGGRRAADCKGDHDIFGGRSGLSHLHKRTHPFLFFRTLRAFPLYFEQGARRDSRQNLFCQNARNRRTKNAAEHSSR